MMSYKRLIPCIFIAGGKAVKWFDDDTVMSDDVIGLAKYYSDHGADELLVFDLSDSDEEHDEAIDLMKRMNRMIRIPMVAGGNIRRQEDIKKILYAGAKRAMLNFSKSDSVKLIEDAAKRFGKEKVAVSLNDFDALFKHQHLINDYSSEIIFMHRLDLNSVMNVTEVPCVIVTDTMEEPELYKILKCPGVKGLSGKFVSQTDMDFVEFKDKCGQEEIKMTSFESMMEFSQFKTNEQGLIRSLYSVRNSPPAVHPRYKFAYARLYGSEDEMAPGTFGLRLFLCFMLFAAFVAMDNNGITVKSVSSDRIVQEITTDLDVAEVWKNL